jgi:hypothetical protein
MKFLYGFVVTGNNQQCPPRQFKGSSSPIYRGGLLSNRKALAENDRVGSLLARFGAINHVKMVGCKSNWSFSCNRPEP